MIKSIFKAVSFLSVAAFFCIGCGDKGDDDPDDGGDGGGGINPSTYTITFNANGGTVSPASGTTGTDGRLASLPTPTRSGYIFDGWYTSQTGGTAVGTSTAFSGNTTIYARWTAGPVTPPSGGTFTDSRDGNTYKKIVIGTQTWMAENLNYAAAESKCYGEGGEVYINDKIPDNRGWKMLSASEVQAYCAKYGRLYNWNIAITACPSGWHLPSDDEWTTLTDYVGGLLTAGTKLKSSQYWESYNGVPTGTDEYGFSALPGGFGHYYDGSFGNANYFGDWWSATEGDTLNAFSRFIYHSFEKVSRTYDEKSWWYSVRCVQN
jgi:uncharacterized protein (TIGR02145 family)/uncharacterized repeat protein (TIGR02543 family)